jgi:butyrate kinase
MAVYENETLLFEDTLRHSNEELAPFEKNTDQYEFRTKVIREAFNSHKLDASTLSAIVGRGGLLQPIPSGVYRVNDIMLKHLKEGLQGDHASNLGGLIAATLAEKLQIPAYIVDPVVVDELDDVARISGLKEVPRVSIFHALNQKAIARHAASDMGVKYEDKNFIVAHLGGGTTVGAHRRGRVVDVNDGINGEGPFTPERTGLVAALPLLKMAFSGEYTHDQMKKMIKGNGGLVSLLGTNSCLDVETRIAEGDKEAALVYDAMSYQIAKEIGAMAAVLEGDVDGIIITGGVARGKQVVEYIEKKVKFIAPVMVYAGEDEMSALNAGGLRVLRGDVKEKHYSGEGLIK